MPVIEPGSYADWSPNMSNRALSLAVTNTATNIVKITVGRPRPDILVRFHAPRHVCWHSRGPSC